MDDKARDVYDPEEAQRRFEKLVRTALNTPPKPMKDMPRKRPVPKVEPRPTGKGSGRPERSGRSA